MPKPRPRPTPDRRPSPVPVRTVVATGSPGPYAPLTVRASLSPGGGTTQTAFTLRIRVDDGDGDAHVTKVDWGDGSSFSPNPGPAYGACASPSPRPPAPYQPEPTHLSVALGHAWRHPGTYRVTLDVVSYPYPCRQGPQPATESTHSTIPVAIGLDRITSNGPAGPAIGALTVSPNTQQPTDVWLGVPMHDTDGWLSSYRIDWGDGSSTTSGPSDVGPCDDGNGRYYPGRPVDPNDDVGFQIEHTYPRRGSYRIVVTAVSSGCQGRDVQRASRAQAFRV